TCRTQLLSRYCPGISTRPAKRLDQPQRRDCPRSPGYSRAARFAELALHIGAIERAIIRFIGKYIEHSYYSDSLETGRALFIAHFLRMRRACLLGDERHGLAPRATARVAPYHTRIAAPPDMVGCDPCGRPWLPHLPARCKNMAPPFLEVSLQAFRVSDILG